MLQAPLAAEDADSALMAEYEEGLVAVFADLAEMFGNPRSYGQIYGLLFAREVPLTMEEVARRLDISQGSISQGLRQLEAFGAVVKEKPDGSRQALYSAKLEMKLLISGFLRERVIPRLESTESRVEEIRRALEADKQSLDQAFLETANHRLGRVAKWHRSARTILPLARKILGGG
jgi:DNA-binding transcriptional regulator GbsR (MarR family)